MQLHITLYEPEIPPNTGNVIRLAANTGARLHLVEPLGFEMSDTRLKRAGMDYRDLAHVEIHANWGECLRSANPTRVITCSTRGTRSYSDLSYKPGDMLVFGPETRGLPQDFLEANGLENCVRIPMQPNSRSLNLANAVAVIAYEAWRQAGFEPAPPGP